MKKTIALILALVAVLSASVAFAADYKVIVNGEEVVFDRQPVVENGVIFIPYRYVAEKLGAKVSWHQETKTVFSFLIISPFSAIVICGSFSPLYSYI